MGATALKSATGAMYVSIISKIRTVQYVSNVRVENNTFSQRKCTLKPCITIYLSKLCCHGDITVMDALISLLLLTYFLLFYLMQTHPTSAVIIIYK